MSTILEVKDKRTLELPQVAGQDGGHGNILERATFIIDDDLAAFPRTPEAHVAFRPTPQALRSEHNCTTS